MNDKATINDNNRGNTRINTPAIIRDAPVSIDDSFPLLFYLLCPYLMLSYGL